MPSPDVINGLRKAWTFIALSDLFSVAVAISLLFRPSFTPIAFTTVVVLTRNGSVYFLLSVVGSEPSTV